MFDNNDANDSSQQETVAEENPMIFDLYEEQETTEQQEETLETPTETETEETEADPDQEATETSADEEDQEEVTPEDADSEEEEAPVEEKPKKNRFQDRINELVTQRNAEKERAQELEKLLEAEREKNAKTEKETTEQKTETEPTDLGPDPDATNEDGTAKYPLGKYDPEYISDLAEFKVEQAQKKIEAAAEEKRKQAEYEASQKELQKNWEIKLEATKGEYEDFDERGEDLLEVVSGYDKGYAEYLSVQIMDMDAGPEVLYYLGSNPDEAKRIMDMGPMKATQELGFLNGKFRSAKSDKSTKNRTKVSKAPEPPVTNRGTTSSMAKVAPDTEDLAAYERAYHRREK